MDNSIVSFKIYLFSRDSQDPEVRRFGLDTGFAYSYRALKDRICNVFTRLSDKPFTLFWIDEEDDEVAVSCDDELCIALTSMKKDVKKFYVRLQSPVGEATGNRGNVLHVGVYCDGCECNIVGYRYKCLMCRDYDLCSACEQAGIHPEHIMLRIPNPSSVENVAFRKMFRYMKLFVPEVKHHDAENGHPCKKRRKHEKRRTCPVAESFNPDSGRYSFLDHCLRELQNLLYPLGETVEIHLPGHHEEKQKTEKKEENRSKESPEPTPAAQNKEGGRASDPEVFSETLKQKINEITKILANQSMGKDAEDDGWVAFEDLKKDTEESRPSTSSEGVPKAPASKPSAPPAEGNGTKSPPQGNLYPNLGPQETPASARVKESLEKMLAMGFTNEGGWLEKLLEVKDGRIEKVLEVLTADKFASTD